MTLSFFVTDRNTRPEDAMYWHVTGKSPYPEVDDTKPNCMNKIVQWMRDDTVPIIQKIGMVALGILATLAVGFVIGQTLLICSIVTVITLLWAQRESSAINRKEAEKEEEIREEAQAVERQRAGLEKIAESFGGRAAVQALPKLDLRGRVGSTGYIDFLQADDLVAPVMTGGDKFGRPFVAMKVHLRGNAAAETVFIAFQRYTGDGQWVYKGSMNHFENANDRELNEIRQILAGQHPQYVLAVVPH